VDDIVVFNALTKKEVSAILTIQVADLSKRLSEQHITLVIKAGARDYLVENGYEPAFGARPMRRLIQREIEDPLSLMIISGKLSSGDIVQVDTKDGKITLKIKKKTILAITQTIEKAEESEISDVAENRASCNKLS